MPDKGREGEKKERKKKKGKKKNLRAVGYSHLLEYNRTCILQVWHRELQVVARWSRRPTKRENKRE